MIEFRIRSLDEEDEQFNDNERKYQRHLNTYANIMGQSCDLFKYFVHDFFHDGQIRAMGFSEDFQEFHFEISCPNIRKAKSSIVSYLKPVWFKCRFTGICGFWLETNKFNESNNPLSEYEKRIIFLSSEVNTMSHEIQHNSEIYGDEFSSIIMKLMPVERNIALIFNSVEVRAVESLAFESIQGNPDYQIPIFDGFSKQG